MARTDNEEKLMLLELPKSIAPYVDEINKDYIFLGSGVDKAAFLRPDGLVSVYLKSNYWISEYKKIQKIYSEKKDWSIFEPKIYNISFNCNIYNITMERFKTADSNTDDYLFDLIIEASSSIEDYFLEFKINKKNKETLSSSDLEIINKCAISSRGSCSVFLKEFDWCIGEIERICGAGSGWVLDIFRSLSYRLLVSEDMDLHSGNIGFRESNGFPVIFDW